MSEAEKRRTFWPGKEYAHEETRALKRPNSDLYREIETSKVAASQPPRLIPAVRVAKHDKDPWHDFARLLTMNRGGKVTVAYSTTKSRKLVAIKEVSECTIEQLRDFRPVLHENIITFTAAYFDKASMFLVYDFLPANLIGVLKTPLGPLKAEDIATICQGILRGLHFIHQELGLEYEMLKGENILFSRNGVVKLANAGSVILKSSGRDFKRDVEATGLILIRMLEPDTGVLYPKLLELRRPSACEPDARDLVTKLPGLELVEALNHPFFTKSRGPQYLVPYVFVAETLQEEDVDVIYGAPK